MTVFNYSIARLRNYSRFPCFVTIFSKPSAFSSPAAAPAWAKAWPQRFLELGAIVHICGRREEVLKATAAELSPKGADPRPSLRRSQPGSGRADDGRDLDLRPSRHSCQQCRRELLARTEELSPRAFESVINIVLMGTLHCTMACGRRWLKSRTAARSSASRLRTPR